MKKRPLTPAIRRLLAHALASGGAWRPSDRAPGKIYRETVEAAEARVLVAIERNRDGEITSATITPFGRSEMGADVISDEAHKFKGTAAESRERLQRYVAVTGSRGFVISAGETLG